MVLSASQVISLEPEWSKHILKIPASESREPGCTAACKSKMLNKSNEHETKNP